MSIPSSPPTQPRLVIASQNPGKLREFQTYLADLAWDVCLMPADLDIPETEPTFLGNACLKAATVAQATGDWAIADDSGLEVAALAGAPGIYSARYGQTDPERIQRLLNELGGELNRQAWFTCALALARPNGQIALTEVGRCAGEILSGPRGENGFGYDPIFYVPSQARTFAEMSAETKRHISHRGVALAGILPKLKQILSSAELF
ncbi:RdgB/HAM1 family non-canonical purine NTP pyrophosphatase [Synechococcus sp. PCC 6312]|uniref:RdgB/HAM1 family non-canonical purine NTP pyrophosphatase n=1 Tax=Synechococcus sp. (strain ATCC 27167 / PCC 6312) TaxID=195253 RepID=UPI00029F4AF9|nr:RdgB/HAM1 family non-canonical purine NTP pyrophosphatase [Synechococcus sp. PCC 6312]AFY59690.1 non-canonical purine NTP pyrophosphatase, rdgB/HAM1 family [Synechococcus sp. PCC 6312]